MLNNRSWITENTEVYTPNGWISIKGIQRIKSLIGVKHNKIVETNIMEYNSYDYSGKIPMSKSKHFIHGKLYHPKDCLWLPDDCGKLPKTRLLPYSGKLFNIITDCNNFFIRNVFNDIDNFDYTLILCVK